MRGFVLKQWNTESGALCISIAFNLPISMIQLVLQTPALSHTHATVGVSSNAAHLKHPHP
jgi:hypothetical protein